MKKLLLLMTMMSLGVSALEYNVVDRYKLMEDRYKLQDFLNDDPEYYNLLSVGAGIDLDVLDMVSELGDVKGDDTAAGVLLDKYKGSEHFLRLALGLEIPLFSFEAWGVKVKPSINVSANGGLLAGIIEEAFSISDITKIADNLDPAITACLGTLDSSDFSPGDDIVAVAAAECGLPAPLVEPYLNKWYAPALAGALSTAIALMAKMDLKGGINFNLTKGGFFGKVGLGALFRTDFTAYATAATVGSNSGIMDSLEDTAFHGFVVADLYGGYRAGIFSVMGGVEELKLATAMDKSDETGELNYGNSVLMRLHSQANIRLAGLSVRPFLGLTNRSGYNLLDGAYLGSDLGFHFLGDRFGIGLRGMLDRSHLSLGVQPRLGIIQINLLGKIPVSSSVDGVKPPTMVSLDLNIFI